MLALVSISSDSAIGRLVRLKKISSCLAPSSKTVKSCSLEIGDVVVLSVDDGDVERHHVDRRAEDLRFLACPAAPRGLCRPTAPRIAHERRKRRTRDRARMRLSCSHFCLSARRRAVRFEARAWPPDTSTSFRRNQRLGTRV